MSLCCALDTRAFVKSGCPQSQTLSIIFHLRKSSWNYTETMKIHSPFHDTLEGLETPAIVVERAVLEQNLARAAEIARGAGVALRPHVKTHKSLRIAALQTAGGAQGLTVAKPSEA